MARPSLVVISWGGDTADNGAGPKRSKYLRRTSRPSRTSRERVIGAGRFHRDRGHRGGLFAGFDAGGPHRFGDGQVLFGEQQPSVLT